MRVVESQNKKFRNIAVCVGKVITKVGNEEIVERIDSNELEFGKPDNTNIKDVAVRRKGGHELGRISFSNIGGFLTCHARVDNGDANVSSLPATRMWFEAYDMRPEWATADGETKTGTELLITNT